MTMTANAPSTPNQRPLHTLISHSLYAQLNTRAIQLEVSKAHIVRVALKQYLGSKTVEQTKLDVDEDLANLFDE